jgi:hypothetical protein
MPANEERWVELCRQAAVEEDPDRLHALIIEINRLLEEKENRLNAERTPRPSEIQES